MNFPYFPHRFRATADWPESKSAVALNLWGNLLSPEFRVPMRAQFGVEALSRTLSSLCGEERENSSLHRRFHSLIQWQWGSRVRGHASSTRCENSIGGAGLEMKFASGKRVPMLADWFGDRIRNAWQKNSSGSAERGNIT